MDHLKCFLVSEGVLVAAFARKSVVHVGDGDDLCGYWDLVALEPVRVASAIPAFVVPTANFVGVFHQRFIFPDWDRVEHLRAVYRVPLHDVELFGREFAWLVQDLVGNRNLSDIVHRRCGADDSDIVLVDLVLVRTVQEFAQEHFGDGVDVQHVHAAFAVAEFHNVAQHGHHHAIVASLFVNLV